MIIGTIEHKTIIRFKNMDNFERYINAIDINYDRGDVTFTGCVYKLNTAQFNVVERSPYAKSTNYMQEIVQYHGRKCYIPTSGHCFTKCIKYFTKKDFTEEILTFIRTKQRRFNVMTFARIQPCCRKYNINIGCFDGLRKNPLYITERDTAIKTHNNHFCLNWKSNDISFDQVLKDELKPHFKVADNVISDKHVKNYIKYEYKP